MQEGVRNSSTTLHAKKWKQLKDFYIVQELQEENGTFNPEVDTIDDRIGVKLWGFSAQSGIERMLRRGRR